MKSLYSFSILILVFSLNYCSGPDNGGDDALGLAAAFGDPVSPCVSSTGSSSTSGSSVKTTEVDASSTACWVYLDLKAGGVKTSAEGTWDLKFKRFVIGTNSGTSGSGNAGACFNASRTALSQVTGSDCTLEIDKLLSQSGGGGFGNANDNANPSLFDWYAYGLGGPNDHTLSPKDRYYLIRASDESTYFALKMTGYYATVGGTSGYPQFQWQNITP